MASHQIVIAYNNDTQTYGKFWMILSDSCGRKPMPQLAVHDILLPGIDQSHSNANNGKDMLLEATSEGRNGSDPHHLSIGSRVQVAKDPSPNNMVKVQSLKFISRTENETSTPPDQRISAWKFRVINQTSRSLGAQSLAIAIAGRADGLQPRGGIQSSNRAAFDTEVASGTLQDITVRSNNSNAVSGLGIGQVNIEVGNEKLSPGAALVEEATSNDDIGSQIEAGSDGEPSTALASYETAQVLLTELPHAFRNTEAVVANAVTEAVSLTGDSAISGSSAQTASVSPDNKKGSHESIRTAAVETDNMPVVGDRPRSLGAATDEEPALSMVPKSTAVRLGESVVTPVHPAGHPETALVQSTPSPSPQITSVPLFSADASTESRSDPRFVQFFRRHAGKLSIIAIVGGIAMQSFSSKSSSDK